MRPDRMPLDILRHSSNFLCGEENVYVLLCIHKSDTQIYPLN
jgi:hypothetical protein